MPDILLIDDNKNYSFGLAGNLRKAGFNIVIAHNGQDGIKLANQSHPDLILCDVKMPEMDGMEIKEILNKESSTASIPFVFLSALSAASIKSSGLEMGADDYITKSVDLLELITRIKVILKRKERAGLQAREDVQLLLDNLSKSLPIYTSHHFRTYLGILTMSLDLVSKNQSSSDQYLEFARNSAYRMKIWMETLIWLNEFDLGRYETNSTPINLELSFLLPIKEVMENWHEKKLQLELELDDDAIIYAPSRSFTQAVCHLVDNACKFSPVSGVITIHLESRFMNDCILSIHDQGIGIPSELRDAVFKRFFQIQGVNGLAENQGMGLGLYMARSFARTQGGDVMILDSDSGCLVQMTLKYKIQNKIQV